MIHRDSNNIVNVVVRGEAYQGVNVEDQERDENHKTDVILNSDTVIDPRAVVVETLDALVTNRTMLRPRCPYDQAFGAELNGVNQLHELLNEEKGEIM